MGSASRPPGPFPKINGPGSESFPGLCIHHGRVPAPYGLLSCFVCFLLFIQQLPQLLALDDLLFQEHPGHLFQGVPAASEDLPGPLLGPCHQGPHLPVHFFRGDFAVILGRGLQEQDPALPLQGEGPQFFTHAVFPRRGGAIME